jgi:hypothetical protein
MRLTLRAYVEFKTFGHDPQNGHTASYKCVPLHVSWQDALDGNRNTVIVTGSEESVEEIEAEDVEDLPREQLVRLLGKFYDRGWCVRFFDNKDTYEPFIRPSPWVGGFGTMSKGMDETDFPPVGTRVLHDAERFSAGHMSGEEFARLRPFRFILDVQYVDLVEASVWAGMLGMTLL